jgi:hypothetical protein
MTAWMAGVVGSRDAVAVEVTDREAERILAWRTGNGGPHARIILELAEKGFGTAVAITAEHEDRAPGVAAALENLLDELGSPERKPFSGG